MPTYQYECAACGYSFEHLQSMMDAKLKKCPECGKLKLHRLIGTGAGVIFKGSGFYETDYKKKDAPKSESPAAEGAASTKPVQSETKKTSNSETKTVKTEP